MYDGAQLFSAQLTDWRTDGLKDWRTDRLTDWQRIRDQTNWPACVTGDVLLDVSPQHVLDVLLLEPALNDYYQYHYHHNHHHLHLDDQLVAAVNGTAGAELSEQEEEEMLGLSEWRRISSSSLSFHGFYRHYHDNNVAQLGAVTCLCDSCHYYYHYHYHRHHRYHYLCSILAISLKFANAVFLLPTLTTWSRENFT